MLRQQLRKVWRHLPALFLKSLVGLLILLPNVHARNSLAERELYDLNQQLGLAQALDIPADGYATIGENYMAYEAKHKKALSSCVVDKEEDVVDLLILRLL